MTHDEVLKIENKIADKVLKKYSKFKEIGKNSRNLFLRRQSEKTLNYSKKKDILREKIIERNNKYQNEKKFAQRFKKCYDAVQGKKVTIPDEIHLSYQDKFHHKTDNSLLIRSKTERNSIPYEEKKIVPQSRPTIFRPKKTIQKCKSEENFKKCYSGGPSYLATVMRKMRKSNNLKYNKERMENAAITIQKTIKMYLERKKYLENKEFRYRMVVVRNSKSRMNQIRKHDDQIRIRGRLFKQITDTKENEKCKKILRDFKQKEKP